MPGPGYTSPKSKRGRALGIKKPAFAYRSNTARNVAPPPKAVASFKGTVKTQRSAPRRGPRRRQTRGSRLASINLAALFGPSSLRRSSSALSMDAGSVAARATKIAMVEMRKNTTGYKLADWAKTQVGTKENSRRHARYAAATDNLPISEPWCSAFVNYGLRKQGKRGPAGAAYSGAWLSWSGGKQVKTPRRGDLVVYDWGDGGITDHVAIYDGSNRVIGGNEENAVRRVPARLNEAVGIVRPK